MGRRGDILALVDGAPGALRTLQGALTSWTHRELAAVAYRRIAGTDEGGGDTLAAVVSLSGAPSDPRAAGRGADTGVGHHDDAAPHLLPAGRRDAPADDVEVVSSWYVVVAVPDRWRVVGRGHLAVSDGTRSWAGTSTLVTERDSTRAAIHDAGAIGACLYPGALLGALELAVPEPDEVAGRSCWVVDARARPDAAGTSLASSAAPHALRLQRDLVGVDHRLWFDAATGIVLRHEGYVDDRMCSWTALSDLVIDAPVAPREFRPPPGAVVRSRHELLRDHLSEMGIDPDTVDLDDPVQVRNALRQGG